MSLNLYILHKSVFSLCCDLSFSSVINFQVLRQDYSTYRPQRRHPEPLKHASVSGYGLPCFARVKLPGIALDTWIVNGISVAFIISPCLSKLWASSLPLSQYVDSTVGESRFANENVVPTTQPCVLKRMKLRIPYCCECDYVGLAYT